MAAKASDYDNYCSGAGKSEKKTISYNDIAAKLLEDRLLLTALELHTEFVGNGREIRVLRDFFSNPGNFEFQTQEVPSRLSRSGSQVTLDSLDLARYSEDGAGGDEKIAVLEFELRKAKETISSLRNNLTCATESASSTPEKGTLKFTSLPSIKPHEKRALNFLVNEYLLQHGYKLTSITFGDENPDQDFDDWDDVGLNIAKLPELLCLYREGLKQTGQNQLTMSTQTDISNQVDPNVLIKEQACELEKLKSKLYFTEANVTELKALNEQLQKEKKIWDAMSTEIVGTKTNPNVRRSNVPDSPERFEFIDRNMSEFRKSDVADSLSNKSYDTNDWTSLHMPEKDDSGCKDLDFTSLSMDPYMKEVFAQCYVNVDENNVILDVLNHKMPLEALVRIVSEALPKIIPNIILNKREEVIPLLMTSIFLNIDASGRDTLLQQLFNIKKKPTEAERKTILTAIVGIAKHSGEQMVENEILPLCWMQLTHKNIERRLLIAEACSVLIPYVSSSIRNSLILSMLQEMLDDKEELVRNQIVKALALLFSMCDDRDKYSQCEQIALNTLNDSSSSFVSLSTEVLYPVLARWALQSDILTSSLFKKLLHSLNSLIKDSESPNVRSIVTEKVHKIVAVIDNLLIFLLISAVSNEHILSNIEKDAVDIRPDFLQLCGPLTNPVILLKVDYNCGILLNEFDKFVGENPNLSWPEMDWIVDIMLPDLLNNLHLLDFSQQSFLNLFSHIFIVFGKNFTKYKIRPILQKNIRNLEQVVGNFNQFCPSINIIPIYLVALNYIEDYGEITTVLKKFVCVLPLCGIPLDCLDITIKKLCESELQELVVDCLWAAVMHHRPLVKSAAANLLCSILSLCNKDLLKSKVVGAIVTLANDNDALVKTAALPALGKLITNCDVDEINDKAYLQLQTIISDPGIKENHSLLRQLIVTFGEIFNDTNASFRNEVLLPQLAGFSNLMPQMTNKARKVDMVVALLETYTQIVYSPLHKEHISSIVKTGLKSVDTIISENPSLSVHRETMSAMIKECDNKSTQSTPASPPEHHKSKKLGQNVNQGVEDMRQKMSKIFTKSSSSKPSTLPNLQSIFKKK